MRDVGGGRAARGRGGARARAAALSPTRAGARPLVVDVVGRRWRRRLGVSSGNKTAGRPKQQTTRQKRRRLSRQPVARCALTFARRSLLRAAHRTGPYKKKATDKKIHTATGSTPRLFFSLGPRRPIVLGRGHPSPWQLATLIRPPFSFSLFFLAVLCLSLCVGLSHPATASSLWRHTFRSNQEWFARVCPPPILHFFFILFPPPRPHIHLVR